MLPKCNRFDYSVTITSFRSLRGRFVIHNFCIRESTYKVLVNHDDQTIFILDRTVISRDDEIIDL